MNGAQPAASAAAAGLQGLRPGRFSAQIPRNQVRAGPDIYGVMRGGGATIRDWVQLVHSGPKDNHGEFGDTFQLAATIDV